MATVDEEAEQLEYSLRHVDVALLPTNRNWSTGTFACHQQPAACLVATACPCVQVAPSFVFLAPLGPPAALLTAPPARSSASTNVLPSAPRASSGP